MKTLFLVSKQDIELAKDEVLALVKLKESFLDQNLLIIDKKIDTGRLSKRLAYTRKIYRLLFYTGWENLLPLLERFPWKEVYEDNFILRISNLSRKKLPKDYNEKVLAGYVWRGVDNPKVRLKDAKTSIELFFTKDKVYCVNLLHKIEKGFEGRRAHKLPKLHPTAMHPKLARAMINLTGIKSGFILDPFCGSGGIMIEAALMGMQPIGFDIDENMVARAKVNLDHFNIKGYELKQNDATRFRRNIDYAVTDLPYGLNSKAEELNNLYTKFLNNLHKRLRKKAVVSFPDFVDYKRIIKRNGFKIEKEYDYYLHKSLSKKIIVIKEIQ